MDVGHSGSARENFGSRGKLWCINRCAHSCCLSCIGGHDSYGFSKRLNSCLEEGHRRPNRQQEDRSMDEMRLIVCQYLYRTGCSSSVNTAMEKKWSKRASQAGAIKRSLNIMPSCCWIFLMAAAYLLASLFYYMTTADSPVWKNMEIIITEYWSCQF